MKSPLYFVLISFGCVLVLILDDEILIEKETRPILITHIISAFRHESIINRTFESMFAAEKYSNVSVQFISVHYEEDESIVPSRFEKYRLARSHQEILPQWNSKKLPIVQEILDIGMKHAVGEILMFSNSDIILNGHFYRWVWEKMQERDSLTINKRLLINVPEDLPIEIYYHIPGINHGGFDCFVWRKELNKKINLGRMFLGYPPWGKSFRALLHQISARTDEFYSWSNLTFHLGNARHWEYRTVENQIMKAANLQMQREWMR